MIDEHTRAEIRRLYAVEKWKVGTISSELGLHPDTVRRAFEGMGGEVEKKDSIAVPYLSFLEETLKEHPHLTSTRLTQMIAERGYPGSVYPVRRLVSKIRPKVRRAYQDLYFFPGEVAQVDWGDFGKFEVAPGKQRRLSLFAMVLAYSRRLFGRFFFDQKMGSLLEGHVCAFHYFGGNPKIVMYDNMKTAVIKNMGKGVQFNDGLLQLAGHYHFRPRACNPRSGWEKGRVERSIRYVRDNFAIETRKYRSIEGLNEQLAIWLLNVSDQRTWPDDSNKTVSKVFGEEKLLDIAGDAFPHYWEKRVRVDKKSMIRFDCNSYSLPPAYVGSWLMVQADSTTVSIFAEDEEVARHQRCWSKEVKVTAPEHIDAIFEKTKVKNIRKNRHVIVRRLSCGEALIKAWGELGESLAKQSATIAVLMANYGAEAVDLAAVEAIEAGTPRSDSIAYLLQKKPEILPKIAPSYSREGLNELEVTPHDLSTYDPF